MPATVSVTPIIPLSGPNTFGGPSGVASQINAAIASRTEVPDIAYPVASSDRAIAYTSLTAARIVSLCAASAFPKGVELIVHDESGACSSTIKITIAAAGSDLISGSASQAITTAYGSMRLRSNGASKWTVV